MPDSIKIDSSVLQIDGHEPVLSAAKAGEVAAAFVRFYEVLARLRAPDGCPWDREQTPLTMRSDLIEETFEAVEAISEEDAPHVREELGDVMLNACMIACMHEMDGKFSMNELLTEVSDKLVRRHPHVFANSEGQSQAEGKAKNSDEVLKQWDKIKQNVEGRGGKSVLDEVSIGLPPLVRAAKLQKKAAKKGFDWQNMDDVYAKVDEEFAEVKQAAACCPPPASSPKDESAENVEKRLHLEEEIGDLLFSVVNVARKLKIDPAVALSRTNQKFCRRFAYVEEQMAAKNIPMDAEHLPQMDDFWNEAKNK